MAAGRGLVLVEDREVERVGLVAAAAGRAPAGAVAPAAAEACGRPENRLVWVGAQAEEVAQVRAPAPAPVAPVQAQVVAGQDRAEAVQVQVAAGRARVEAVQVQVVAGRVVAGEELPANRASG